MPTFDNDNPIINVGDSITLTLYDTSRILRTVYVASGKTTITNQTTTTVTLEGVSEGTDYLNFIIIETDGSQSNGSILVTVKSNSSSSEKTQNAFLGQIKLVEIFLGESPILRLYVGETLVFDNSN